MFGLSLIPVISDVIDKVFTGVEANNQMKMQMMQWSMSQEGQAALADAEDRISARNRQALLSDNTTTLMAIFLFVGFFVIAIAFIVGSKYLALIPQAYTNVIMYFFGTLSTAFLMVVSYYFGSSTSADKGMAQLTQNLPGVTNELQVPAKKHFRLF